MESTLVATIQFEEIHIYGDIFNDTAEFELFKGAPDKEKKIFIQNRVELEPNIKKVDLYA